MNVLTLIRRPMAPTAALGGTLVALGLTLTGLVLAGFDDDAAHTTHRIGMTTLIVGTILMVYAGLRRRGRSIEEAYRLGYDVGFENGFHAHVEDLIERAETDAPSERRRHRRSRNRDHSAVDMLDLDDR